MQNLRKLDDGFEIDGKKFIFSDVQSIKYLRSNIQHIGTVNSNVANDELEILIKGSYVPIKIGSISKIYFPAFSGKSSKQNREFINDFYNHINKNTIDNIFFDYDRRINSSDGLKYGSVILFSNGDFKYDGGVFNIKNNPPEFYYSYPNLVFKVGFGNSVGKGIMRVISGNLTTNLEVDITYDTDVFFEIFKRYFGYTFN